MRVTIFKKLGAAALALCSATAASAQGAFPVPPNRFSDEAIARTDAPLKALTPVTDATLRDPPPGDWLMWRRTYDGWGYSPLSQINRGNVKNLRLAWAWSLPRGASELTPLVHDGILFVQGYGDQVEALNAATGDLLWRYTRTLPKDRMVLTKRFMAIYGEALLIATSDKHIVALDVRTGKALWDAPVAGGGSFSGGPMVANGTIVIGHTFCDTERCAITGHDVKDGHELWRFYTVAAPDEPGGDTWNGLPADQRFGGSVWTGGSYDPATNTMYWGVGQPYPWNAFARGTSPLRKGQSNEALYTDNTLALDPNTGKLKWHFSHLPNDSWDMDYVFERELIDLPVNGRTRKLSITSGKMAIIEALDAADGKFAWSLDLGLQSIVRSIDPKTGRKTINPEAIVPIEKPTDFCPHPGGARSIGSTAYDPQTKLLFVPLQEDCTAMTAYAKDPGEKSADSSFVLKPRPDGDGLIGRLTAIDLEGRKVAWTYRERAPQSSAALPTAGGLVFEGAYALKVRS